MSEFFGVVNEREMASEGMRGRGGPASSPSRAARVRYGLSIGLCAGALAVASPSPAAAAADELVAGEALQKGSTFFAGEPGATYALRGGAQLIIAEGSEYTFDPSIRLQIGKPGAPDTMARSMRLLKGRVDISVPTTGVEPTAVFLRTPGKLSAVAKEGRSTLVVTGDSATAASRSGEMLVALGGYWKPLRAGFARTLTASDPMALPHTILDAPRPSVKHPLLTVTGAESTTVEAGWQALPDAATYDATIFTSADGTAVLSHQVMVDTSFQSALPPGSYALSVTALDRFGLPSARSELQTVRIVGIEAPNGSETTLDGAIVIDKDQSVTLLKAQGLEVGYDKGNVFGTSHGSLGLIHGEPTSARLRVPGTLDEAVVRLEPKGLRAHVDVGPKLANWPVDRVTIDIDVYDATGRPIPDDIRFTTVVTVNMAPVHVAWQRAGRVLRGVLPPSDAPGPWIVRAEVTDDRGHLIGRNFLEVARVRGAELPLIARR